MKVKKYKNISKKPKNRETFLDLNALYVTGQNLCPVIDADAERKKYFQTRTTF
jgi:hypothetical protein